MSRIAHTQTKTALRKSHVVGPIVLVELDFAHGKLRLCNAPMDIEFDSNNNGAKEIFIGVGHLGKVSTIEEGREIKPYSLTLELSGMPQEVVAIALKEHYQGRSGKIFLAFLDETNTLLRDPFLIFSGRMDNMTLEVGETATIALTMQSRLADWERPRIKRYSHESHARKHKGDRFFEFIPLTATKEIVWGR